MWTEFITTSDEVERMLYPRTCALAETLWNTKEKKEWEGFRQRISKFGAIMEKLNICYFKDEDWDNTGFVPQSEQRPRLVCPARIDTNMKGIKYYMPEYAFDGDIQTFFATPYSLKKGDYFTLTLEKDKQYRKSELCLMFQRNIRNMYNYLSARTVQYLRK